MNEFFRSALKECVEELNGVLNNLGAPPFSIAHTASGQHLIPFALKDLHYPPSQSTPNNTLVLFFDIAYLGTQIIDTLWRISRSPNTTHIILIVPLATQRALIAIKKEPFPPHMKLHILTGKTRLKTAKECIPLLNRIALSELVDVSPNVLKGLALSYAQNRPTYLLASSLL